jgi:hypothetical protein
MKRTTPQYWTISIIILSAIFASLVTLCAALMPSCTTRTRDAARRHQEDEAMAAATLQKEKDAAKKEGLKAVIEKDNLNAAANTILPHEPLPTVVSPPSAPNLNSLLTGHVGQEVGTQVADGTIAMDMDINTQDDEQVDDKVKSPKKRNQLQRPPQPTPRMPISWLSRLLLVKMMPPPMLGVRGVATPRRPPTVRPHRPLVMRKSNPWHRPAADSPLQLPSLIHGEGKADRGIKWFVWRGWYS